MTRPYSNDLRERVARSMIEGRSARETAKLFGVSVASVVKWQLRMKATGTAAHLQMGGYRKRVLLGEKDWLLGRLSERPDLTVRALEAELAERGIVVSHNTVWTMMRASGLSSKKKPLRHRAVPRSHARVWRRRHLRQPGTPQGRSGPQGDPRRRCQYLLPAVL